jgi:hypothetical protein
MADQVAAGSPGTAVGATEAASTSRPRSVAGTWGRALLVPVGAFVASRLMVLAAAGLATWIHPQLTIGGVLNGWDAGWFLSIATHGYPSTLASSHGGGAWAFFPGVPAVLHGLVAVTAISYIRAGEVVGVLFGLTAVLAVWLAVRQEMGAEVADRTAILLSFFPAAYVLSMPYSEGLFLTAAALCIYLLGRRSWLLAGVAASVASLARDPGIVLVGVCVVVGLVEVASRRTWRPLAAILTAPIGFVLWTLYQWHEVGSPIAFLHAEVYWGQGLQWFGEPLLNLWHLVSLPGAWAQANEVLGGLSMVFVLVAVGLLVHAQLRGHPISLSWWLYAAGTVLVALSTHWGGSVPRFVMVVFPLLAIVAARVPRRFQPVVIAGAAMLEAGLAVVVFTTLATWQTAPFAP